MAWHGGRTDSIKESCCGVCPRLYAGSQQQRTQPNVSGHVNRLSACHCPAKFPATGSTATEAQRNCGVGGPHHTSIPEDVSSAHHMAPACLAPTVALHCSVSTSDQLRVSTVHCVAYHSMLLIRSQNGLSGSDMKSAMHVRSIAPVVPPAHSNPYNSLYCPH